MFHRCYHRRCTCPACVRAITGSSPAGRTARAYDGGVDNRQVAGSWLQGPGSVLRDADDYPGKRLGLPQQGPGSVARFGRRLLAIGVDWGLALLIAHGLLGGGSWTTLGVFTAMTALLLASAGRTIGQRLLGVRLVQLSGAAPGVLRSAGRSLLLALAVPALIWDRDQRGLHDRTMGTVLLRT